MKTSSLPLRTLVTTAACALLSASSFAQAPAPAPGAPAAPATPGAPAATPAPKPLGPMEKNFLKNAAKSTLLQLELSKTAKAITDTGVAKVRDGAIKDLTKVQAKLAEFATSRGEKPVTELEGADKADVERLAKTKEDKMVKEYLEAIVKESKRLDKEFESAGKTLQDADTKMVIVNYGQLVHGVYTSSEAAEKAAKDPKNKNKK